MDYERHNHPQEVSCVVVPRVNLMRYLRKRMGRTKPTVSSDYIVGLTDGEGCFFVNISKSSAYRSGWQVQLHFHIKLRAEDEEVLWKIRNTLQCGNVYFQKEQRENHTQCYRYSVSALRDIHTYVIPFFTEHPLQTTSKQKSFNAFRKIAILVHERAHLTEHGVEKIRALKQTMNQRTNGLA